MKMKLTFGSRRAALDSLDPSTSPFKEKRWTDKIVDFLLGPRPHPVYLAGVAAGFGGPGPSRDRSRQPDPRRKEERLNVPTGLTFAGISSRSIGDSMLR